MRGLVALFLAVAVAGCGGSASNDQPTGGIVFTVNREGFNEVWVMTADGRNRRRLTETAPKDTHAAGSMQPAWSPQGDRIAFVGTGDAKRQDPRDQELYVLEGGEAHRLTRNDEPDSSPAWTRDGRAIAVARHTGYGTERAHGTVYLVDPIGGAERRLFGDEELGEPVYLSGLAWSPDGQRLAFTRTTFRGVEAQPAIYVVDADGAHERRLVADAAEAAWSPDGSRIAFTSFRDRFGRTCFQECSLNGEIYTASEDGTGLRRLTRSQAVDSSPAWSPDGRRIVFGSDRSNPRAHAYELYVVDADDGEPKRLTRNRVWDLDPDWR